MRWWALEPYLVVLMPELEKGCVRPIQAFCKWNSNRDRSCFQANSEHYLNCWLLTDSGDALFLDEGKCDGRVYHIKSDDFADYCLLEDPETVLDNYLAHYVTTQSPEAFDFRA